MFFYRHELNLVLLNRSRDKPKTVYIYAHNSKRDLPIIAFITLVEENYILCLFPQRLNFAIKLLDINLEHKWKKYLIIIRRYLSIIQFHLMMKKFNIFINVYKYISTRKKNTWIYQHFNIFVFIKIDHLIQVLAIYSVE